MYELANEAEDQNSSGPPNYRSDHLHIEGYYYSFPVCSDCSQYPSLWTNSEYADLEDASQANEEKPLTKRNQRERLRVKQVNAAFAQLQTHLPMAPEKRRKERSELALSRQQHCNAVKPKRVSKVNTLRAAIAYIDALAKMLSPA